jgi:hypothetical protein
MFTLGDDIEILEDGIWIVMILIVADSTKNRVE